MTGFTDRLPAQWDLQDTADRLMSRHERRQQQIVQRVIARTGGVSLFSLTKQREIRAC